MNDDFEERIKSLVGSKKTEPWRARGRPPPRPKPSRSRQCSYRSPSRSSAYVPIEFVFTVYNKRLNDALAVVALAVLGAGARGVTGRAIGKGARAGV